MNDERTKYVEIDVMLKPNSQMHHSDRLPVPFEEVRITKAAFLNKPPVEISLALKVNEAQQGSINSSTVCAGHDSVSHDFAGVPIRRGDTAYFTATTSSTVRSPMSVKLGLTLTNAKFLNIP